MIPGHDTRRLIAGVIVHEIAPHEDERQAFREMLKTNRIRQINHCCMRFGVTKLRHYHRFQTDWWYVVSGGLTLHLHDARENSLTIGQTWDIEMNAGLPQIVEIPPMVIHGCTVTIGACDLIYATDREYDPADEFRIP